MFCLIFDITLIDQGAVKQGYKKIHTKTKKQNKHKETTGQLILLYDLTNTQYIQNNNKTKSSTMGDLKNFISAGTTLCIKK